MKPNNQFLKQPKHFWANVRTISEEVGYTVKKQIRIPTIAEVRIAFQNRGLDLSHIADERDELTPFGKSLFDYYRHRAHVLNSTVEPLLMDAKRAKQTFEQLYEKLKPSCPTPMNKQSGTMKNPAYFTGIINTLIEANAEGLPCDYDPRGLTTVTRRAKPLRTLARRIDGAFPNVTNPIAVWEIKEYYYTTTFGSRVSDGVYETLLDGMELEELWEHEGIKVKHYYMIDGHYTWWECGRSYLCRIIDMLHMGYVDEVLFGAEVVERLPIIVKEWVSTSRSQG